MKMNCKLISLRTTTFSYQYKNSMLNLNLRLISSSSTKIIQSPISINLCNLLIYYIASYLIIPLFPLFLLLIYFYHLKNSQRVVINNELTFLINSSEDIRKLTFTPRWKIPNVSLDPVQGIKKPINQPFQEAEHKNFIVYCNPRLMQRSQ